MGSIFNYKNERILYFVVLIITLMIHCVVFLPVISKNKKKTQKINIRLAGHEDSLNSQGDLSQMAKPKNTTKKFQPTKQLQVSQQTSFQMHYVRKISRPITSNSKVKKSLPSEPPSKIMPAEMDLSELGYKPVKEIPTLKYHNNNIPQFIEQSRIFEKLSGQIASLDLQKLSSSVQIEIPHGTSIDKLNSAERKFYSFRQRSFKAYVYSLLNQAYRQQTSIHPFPFVDKAMRLQAKVTFDKNGDIIRIKTVESGDSKRLQNVFLMALDDIKAIPNPPTEIINEDGEFTLNFSLQIYR